MAVYTVIPTPELAQIAQQYGISSLNGSRWVTAGSVNTHYVLEAPRAKFLLKIDEIKSEAEVRREIDLLLFLRKHGFPCPEPISDRRGQYSQQWGGKSLSLYRYIDGHGITTKHATVQIEQAGRMLATLHGVCKAYKKGIENRFSFDRVAEIYEEVRPRLPEYFKKIRRTLDEECEYLQNYLEGKLPKGIVHGDLFPDNLLFKGQKLLAVLDFEAAGRGKFIFDMATAVNALCFDLHRNEYRLRWFEAFVAGYESLRTLSLAEWDAFPNELRFSAFRFTVTRLRDFFLKPMDGDARVNKDFREFYERLRVLRRERDGGMEGLLMAMATGYDYRKYQRVKALEKKGA